MQLEFFVLYIFNIDIDELFEVVDKPIANSNAVGVLEIGDGVIGMGSVGIGSLNGSSTHFLFTPTLILVAAVGLIINTQSDTADKSSIRGSSNERNLIVKSTA